MRQRLALFLVVLAAVLTAVLLWGVKDNRLFKLEAPGSAMPVVKNVSATTVETDAVTDKPQFNGEDAKGHVWQLNAERATQSGTISDSVVGLDEAHGWWQNTSTTITGKADHGDYYPEQKVVSLKGNVVMTTSDTVINTPALKADMDSQQISGTSGVSLTRTLSSQTMHAKADAFTVDPQTKKTILKGNVHVRLEPK